MKHLAISLTATLLLVCIGANAAACTCMLRSVEEQFELSDRVVSGTVESVEVLEMGSYEIHRANVRVNEIFKGALDGRLLVDSWVIGSCTFSLAVDEEYLIYALDSETEGIYQTSDCQRTRLRIYAEDDIVKLPDPTFAVQTEASSWSSVKSRFEGPAQR